MCGEASCFELIDAWIKVHQNSLQSLYGHFERVINNVTCNCTSKLVDGYYKHATNSTRVVQFSLRATLTFCHYMLTLRAMAWWRYLYVYEFNPLTTADVA